MKLALFIWTLAALSMGAAFFTKPPAQGALIIMALGAGMVGCIVYAVRDDEG